ncbi:GtrA family protein [Pseudomonas lactis]|uniref:GtrA family protein n=1 Tax=Pseudomonas lactis TaxID=1615674 RepID=UPI00110C8D49|nr:GtrA family protein [Pseudomonas lactis]MBK3446131.1 GtrA family protein [Pseudomonas lactis]
MGKVFLRYVSVGVINTLIHWAVFAIIFYGLDASQAVSNLLGFAVAVTFSFFVNARFTFSSDATAVRYLLYVAFMGALAATFGWLAELWALPPIVTLVLFSGVSLVCGFLYARFVVFSKEENAS